MHSLQDRDLLKTQAFIGGAFVGRGTLAVANPSTGAVVSMVPDLGADAAEQAVASAQTAFQTWSEATVKDRARLLRGWFDLIVRHRADLAVILTSEQGKPYQEALGEIDYAAAYVEFYAEEAKRLTGEILPAFRADTQSLVYREPVGVVAAITPWNFPAAMVTRKVAPALAAGCTIVLKPAPETPLTALALAELARRAGLPAGTFNVVTGDAIAIGGVLTSHPDIRLVSFTGSTGTGRKLMAQCATTVKKVALELGGNAPFIVFDDADIDNAVEAAMFSKFRNMGQTCVCTNRFYVQSNIHDAFVTRLADRIAALNVGDGFAPDVAQGPLINAAAVAKVEAHIADAVTHGAQIVVGGKRHERGGTFFEPTLLTGANHTMAFSREETFGPLAAVMRFDEEAEVIRAANATETGLAAYVFTKDMARSIRVSRRLEYGMVGVNTSAISSEMVPFGGIKQSGNSREGSQHGLHEFTNLKYVCTAANQ